jgi:hypothetical protein
LMMMRRRKRVQKLLCVDYSKQKKWSKGLHNSRGGWEGSGRRSRSKRRRDRWRVTGRK